MDVNEVGTYHCVSRCVRRAYLCGYDSQTKKNFNHRRGWIAQRLEFLSSIFGIEVLGYSVMSNHFHVLLRSRPDKCKSWSAEEVARRWLELCPGKSKGDKELEANAIRAFVATPKRVEECRSRLGDISWFMRGVNENIARRSNREEGTPGRFWEGRFKCQRLEDEGAILACMAYVDLNPVRAKKSATLEGSRFTSIRDRLVSKRAKSRLSGVRTVTKPTVEQKRLIDLEQNASKRADWLVDLNGPESPFREVDLDAYISLVEWTGQEIRRGKRGYLPANLEPVMDRLELDKQKWVQNVKSYGGLFYRIAGRLEQLVSFAGKKGQHWFQGHKGSGQLYGKHPSVVA